MTWLKAFGNINLNLIAKSSHFKIGAELWGHSINSKHQ